MLENWQSEYLQFFLYVLLTVHLVQRGSPESKSLGQEGRESEEEQKIGRFAAADSRLGEGGWVADGDLLALAAAAGRAVVPALLGRPERVRMERLRRSSMGSPHISWYGYVRSAESWESTLQNRQSEFLAVGSFAVFAIYLRQRGSPESKPVGSAHMDTGVEG